jgi:hypothetical protein
MNNLSATWRDNSAEADVRDELDTVELLSLAYDRLARIPELGEALGLVDAALIEVLAWSAERPGPRSKATLRV